MTDPSGNIVILYCLAILATIGVVGSIFALAIVGLMRSVDRMFKFMGEDRDVKLK